MRRITKKLCVVSVVLGTRIPPRDSEVVESNDSTRERRKHGTRSVRMCEESLHVHVNMCNPVSRCAGMCDSMCS